MKFRFLSLLLAAALLLTACASTEGQVNSPKKPAVDVTSDSLYVQQVADLPDDFTCPWCKHPADDFEPIYG